LVTVERVNTTNKLYDLSPLLRTFASTEPTDQFGPSESCTSKI
jgi:hypothetical protein